MQFSHSAIGNVASENFVISSIASLENLEYETEECNFSPFLLSQTDESEQPYHPVWTDFSV